MFKTLIGKGHAEFSTKKQQDVHEFLLHLFNAIEVGILPALILYPTGNSLAMKI